ncbi:hypothetical protein BGW38_000189 [Lunasporangiospora selenospora]|uniref:Thioredoxin domain-containing protein n=1 Tax=Lunasporangiospora selenospora TaxID=979761 RepID=A0A9P6FV76_9FUNG|nr:hypothetical protein BGW38_000189 [Lunasporangiospora selenospora]
MKFLNKYSLIAIVGALALCAAPALAQYGPDEDPLGPGPQHVQAKAEADAKAQEAAGTPPPAVEDESNSYLRPEYRGLSGLYKTVKAMLIGGEEFPPLVLDDTQEFVQNVTDANFRESIFNDEWIVTFCSFQSPACIDYYPTLMEAAEKLKDQSNAKFGAVWVEENSRLSARFFVPARLPYVIHAKDGEFRQIPYIRNDTQFLVNFIEEEEYQYYPIMGGLMGPYSTIASWFEKYADGMEWVGQYTSWMPRWMVLIIAGSMSGAVFSFFSGGSNYSSDPSKYAHLNADGTLKATTTKETVAATTSSSKTTKTTSKKRSTKKA